jgi:FMN reductase
MDTSLVAVNASPSTTSRTHALAAAGVELAGAGRVVDLGELDASALLGRSRDPRVDSLLQELPSTPCLLLVTPVYRATYSGLLKVVLDQLPPDALAGTACILAATGASPAHMLSLDTGLRPVVASLGGWSVPTTVYAVHGDFDDAGKPSAAIRARLSRALQEAALVGAAG